VWRTAGAAEVFFPTVSKEHKAFFGTAVEACSGGVWRTTGAAEVFFLTGVPEGPGRIH
jgi:hypothetical protein